MQVKFKYVFNQNLVEAAAGSGAQQLWNLNGLYDPDSSGVGHQPLYYDQLLTGSGPYYNYTVTRCHVKISCSNLSAHPVVVAFYVQPGPVDFPPVDRLIEKPDTTWAICSGTAGQPRTVLNKMVSISRSLGVPERKVMDDDSLSGVWNANPSKIVYGIFMIYATAPSPSIGNVSFITELEFSGWAWGLAAVGSS